MNRKSNPFLIPYHYDTKFGKNPMDLAAYTRLFMQLIIILRSNTPQFSLHSPI